MSIFVLFKAFLWFARDFWDDTIGRKRETTREKCTTLSHTLYCLFYSITSIQETVAVVQIVLMKCRREEETAFRGP